MIPKKISGRGPTKGNFSSCLSYLLQPLDQYGRDKQPTIVASNMGGRTQAELAAEFREIQSCANRRGDPVWHVSLAAHPSEQFSNQQWALFAIELINRVGRLADPQNEVGISTENNQYVVIRHHNEEHSHVHILLNRVNLQGQTCYCNWSIKTLHAACAELERDYGLLQCDHDKSQRNGKKQHSSMSPQVVERLEAKETQTGTHDVVLEKERSRLSVRSFLQEAIDSATADSPSMPLLFRRLQEQGIEAKIAYTRTGKIKGISYALEDTRFTGTLLGKHYTFQGLMKYKGIQYENDLDQESWRAEKTSGTFGVQKEKATQSPPASPALFNEPTPIADTTQIAAYLQLFELLFDQQEPSVPSALTPKAPQLPPLPQLSYSKPKPPEPIAPDRLQTELAQKLYPDLAQVWERYKKQSKEVQAGARVLKGNNYALIYDSGSENLWIVHRQRGTLVQYKDGKVELANRITPEDLANFSQIAAAQQQPPPKAQQQSQMEL